MDAALKTFDAFYKDSLKKYQIVGSSFAMVHDNQVVDRQFYGTEHFANKYPGDEDTIYHWASILKPYTGIAIMQRHDRGQLRLQDPLG